MFLWRFVVFFSLQFQLSSTSLDVAFQKSHKLYSLYKRLLIKYNMNIYSYMQKVFSWNNDECHEELNQHFELNTENKWRT